MFICRQKPTSFPNAFSGDIAKIRKLLILGSETQMKRRKLRRLSACQKKFLIHFFLRYYILKNPAIWLAKSILAHWRTRILPDMGSFFKKSKKPSCGAILNPKMNFPGKKKAKSVLKYLNLPTIVQKSEMPNWWTDWQWWFDRTLRRTRVRKKHTKKNKNKTRNYLVGS